MPAPHKAGHEGLNLGKRVQDPGLKELTIELGESDIYIHMAKKLDLDDGHTLYEATMTDAHGSRIIFIDKEEILDCLRDNFIRGAPGVDEKPEKK